jgi:hypothetical protein
MIDIKNIIIFLGIFLLILWLQHNDDIRFNKTNRVSLYDKVKLPLVSALLVILLKEVNFDELFKENKPVVNIAIESPKQIDVLNDIYLGPPDF